MLLVDASNIAVGGGKVLLEYLMESLESKKIEYALIYRKGSELKIENGNLPVRLFTSEKPRDRSRVLKNAINQTKPDTLLCFGNYPPPFKTGLKTITYFHNPYLVRNPIEYFRFDKFLFFRQLYLKLYLTNTDYFIFQSSLIRDLFMAHHGIKAHQQYFIIPFYNDAAILKQKTNLAKENRFIYVSHPYPHKNHTGLFDAWKQLAERKLFPELVVTIPEEEQNQHLIRQIASINGLGGKVVNLGSIQYDKALYYTARSKYVIFPSLDETFGLGLIEGAILDCQLLTSNYPFVGASVNPSLTFDPLKANEIAECIETVLSGKQIPDSTLIAKNKIEELINLLN